MKQNLVKLYSTLSQQLPSATGSLICYYIQL